MTEPIKIFKVKPFTPNPRQQEVEYHLGVAKTVRKMIANLSRTDVGGFRVLLEELQDMGVLTINESAFMSKGKDEMLVYLREMQKAHNVERAWKTVELQYGDDGTRRLHERLEDDAEERGEPIAKHRNDASLVKSFKRLDKEMKKRGLDPNAFP